ncbi:ABC transporter ATP-binding protein, partial [bacterium]|nr:ABC transporter ATP-binding protein [bacterium]
MAEIVLKNISKIYDIKTGTPAVDNVNLHIHDKEFLVLLGPSGCGKTSTLRMIAGLEEITSGEILFDGKKVNDLYPGERNIAMAFESYALYQHLTVWENIAFPLKTRKLKKEVISERVRWTAEMLHITDILTKRPTELSGGQMQRVSLARAMVRNPNAFLFDEPLSHLDMKQRQHMRAELKRLNADLKTT